jgi:biotin synthase
LNAKSGLCAEDCLYCSQSKISKAQIEKYPFLKEEEILKSAGRALELGASRFCMVNSGREPSKNEVAKISSAVMKVREKYPKLELCVCLGILTEEVAKELKKCGVFAYNHNLNTSENFYPEISSTHSYQDRLKTVGIVKEVGLSACSGCIFGIGEKDEDRIALAFELKKIGADSIPLNFLIPIPGTPLENRWDLSPQKCLKIIALFRFINPKSEIRIAGGREVNLRWLQPLGLYAANSIFIGDYLTTKGQKPETDISMIHDMGFEIEGKIQKKDSDAQREFSVVLK